MECGNVSSVGVGACGHWYWRQHACEGECACPFCPAEEREMKRRIWSKTQIDGWRVVKSGDADVFGVSDEAECEVPLSRLEE
jgi:hypothetical protein